MSLIPVNYTNLSAIAKESLGVVFHPIMAPGPEMESVSHGANYRPIIPWGMLSLALLDNG